MRPRPLFATWNRDLQGLATDAPDAAAQRLVATVRVVLAGAHAADGRVPSGLHGVLLAPGSHPPHLRTRRAAALLLAAHWPRYVPAAIYALWSASVHRGARWRDIALSAELLSYTTTLWTDPVFCKVVFRRVRNDAMVAAAMIPLLPSPATEGRAALMHWADAPSGGRILRAVSVSSAILGALTPADWVCWLQSPAHEARLVALALAPDALAGASPPVADPLRHGGRGRRP